MQSSVWNRCVRQLRSDLSEQQFNTWIRPLQAVEDDISIKLLAPNRFVVDWVNANCIGKINELVRTEVVGEELAVTVEVGSRAPEAVAPPPTLTMESVAPISQFIGGKLNPENTFERFVEGKSNQLARAAAMQVGQNPGSAYNPLFIYGGVGLGKTHLMQSVGNLILENQPGAQVAYVHSEKFVGDMVKALQHNTLSTTSRKLLPLGGCAAD